MSAATEVRDGARARIVAGALRLAGVRSGDLADASPAQRERVAARLALQSGERAREALEADAIGNEVAAGNLWRAAARLRRASAEVAT